MSILNSKSRGLPMVLALSTALLVSCGDSKPPATQVVAKVNKDEITSHQIDYLASKTRMTPETAAQTRQKILERLVDQQLAVQQAIDKKLDRSPEVIAAMDLAKREILARAYFAHLGVAIGEPTEAETKAYYTEHPELFAQRKAFVLQEITVPAAKAPKDLLRQQVAANKPLPEISALLKKENIPHSANAAKVTSEQVPLSMLPRVHQLKDGQTGLVETPQAVFLLRVMNSQPAPIDENAAQRPIRQLLAMQKNRDLIAQTMADLKQKANIEYLSADYSPSAAKPAAQAASSNAPAQQAPAPTTSTPDSSGNAAAPSSALNIESGVKGFR